LRLQWIIAGICLSVVWSQNVAGEGPPVRAITFKDELEQRTVIGEVLKQYVDGSTLMLAPDGGLLTLGGEQIAVNVPSDVPMPIASDAEIIQSLKTVIGEDFQFLRTRNYLIAYDTNIAYAEWVGQLFERLKRGFYNYWHARRVTLREPRFPLVAIVFSSKAGYLAYGEREIGASAQSMYGYYNLNSNRVVTYDLTGVDGLVSRGERVHTQAMVNQILSRPQAERTVATIVHEAVHQLSFNSGLQVRLADNPIWLSEGLAMFFEAPDFTSPQGWSIGNVNYHNLRLFRAYLPRRPDDSLESLLRDDQRFKDGAKVIDAYPESWALTYFLIKTKGRQFSAFLNEIAALEPLGEVTAAERLELFEKHFGDLQKLNKAFVSYILSLR
jgi:hypothetical protein